MNINLKKIESWILVIGVVLCGLYLSPNAFDRALTSRHIIWCGFVMLLLVSFFIRKPDIYFDVIPMGLIILLLLECLSGFNAVNKSEWLYVVLRTALMVISVFLFAQIDKKYLIRALVVLGAAYFCIAQYEFINTAYVDSKGIFCNRNPWAAAHFLILPFCYYLIKDRKWRWFAVSVGVGLTVNLFLLMTRSVLVGLGVFWLTIFILDKGSRKYLLALGIIAVGIIWFFRFDRFINTETILDRKEIWTATLIMFKNNPFGIGAGNWRLAIFPYIKYVNLADSFVAGVWRNPHNDFLLVLSESGFLGLLTYLGLFWFAVRRAVKSKSTFLAAGLLGYMAIAFFSFPKERPFLSLILCVMLAMTIKNEGIGVKSSRSFFVICLIILSMFCVVLGYRHRALKYYTGLLRSNSWKYPLEHSGFSLFSTLTFKGVPWHWYTGVAKYKIGENGIYDFNHALKYSPHSVHVLNSLGASYGRRGDMEQAEKYIKECLDLYPDFKDAKINMKLMIKIKEYNGYK